MYKLKVRNIGQIVIKDGFLGKEILKQFQLGNLPPVVDINGKTFLSRLIEGIEKEPIPEKLLHQYTDSELRILAKSFGEKVKYAKSIPELDYSKNEVFPYSTNLLLHIFYVNECISNNNLDKIYRVSINYSASGEQCISGFLKLHQEYMAVLELRDRYPEKYTNYCEQFYNRKENIKYLDKLYNKYNNIKSV
jgi:hypothetical protein